MLRANVAKFQRPLHTPPHPHQEKGIGKTIQLIPALMHQVAAMCSAAVLKIRDWTVDFSLGCACVGMQLWAHACPANVWLVA
jgi:hypothetical protein